MGLRISSKRQENREGISLQLHHKQQGFDNWVLFQYQSWCLMRISSVLKFQILAIFSSLDWWFYWLLYTLSPKQKKWRSEINFYYPLLSGMQRALQTLNDSQDSFVSKFQKQHLEKEKPQNQGFLTSQKPVDRLGGKDRNNLPAEPRYSSTSLVRSPEISCLIAEGPHSHTGLCCMCDACPSTPFWSYRWR